MKRLACLLFLAACHRDPAAGRALLPVDAATPARTPWPAGPLTAEFATVSGAFFFTGPPKVDPLAVFDGACRKEAGRLGPPVERRTSRMKVSVYEAPPVSYLEHMSFGVTPGEREAIQHGPNPMLLNVRGPASRAPETLRAYTELAACVQRETGGLFWDEDTRQLFSLAELKKRRLDPWPPGTAPNPQAHLVMHAYEDGELTRMVTLGMNKLGLPDVVVNGVAPNFRRQIGGLLNATMGAMQNTAVTRPGELVVDLRSSPLAEARASVKETEALGGKARVTLHLVVGARQEGDSPNRLAEIAFDAPGTSPTEQQGALVEHFYGGLPDDVDRIPDEASNRAQLEARAALRRLKPRFDQGLRLDEHLSVKAPFHAGDQVEWMWFQVTSWKGKRLRGTLANDPIAIPDLKLGAIVEANADEIGDYSLYSGDELEEGQILARIMNKKPPRPRVDPAP